MKKRLVAATAAINLFVFALAGLSITQSRLQYQERAEITTQNLARVLEENIAGAIDKIDMSLLSVQDEVRRQIAGGIDAKALNAFLAQQQDHQPEILSLRATDTEGVVRYGRGVPSSGGPKNSDREYYLRARDELQPGLIVTKPMFARIDKKWVIVLARRLSRPDGSFAGVVYANVALAHLSKTFSEIDVGQHGTIALRGGDLGLITRHPEPKNLGEAIGGKPSAALEKLVQSGLSSATYLTSAARYWDSIERTYTVTYRKLADKPFYINAALALNDYLAVWRQETVKILGLTLLFVLTTLFSSWLLYRSWKHQAAAADALREQNEFLNTILENEPECVKILAPNGELLQMNLAGLAMLEVDSILEAKKSGLLGFILPEHRDAFIALSQRVFGGESGTLEFPIEGKKGTRRWLDTHAAPLHDAKGKVTALVAVTRDVTQSKLAEQELKRSNAELEQFSYAISHDMRQPLRMISSYLQLLEKRLAGELDGERREFFNFAIDGAQRLDQMLLALLEYSRVGRKGEPPEWIESRALLDEALRFLQPAIAEAQAEVKITGEWPHVFVSRNEMMRLIQNLIGNAVKYRVAERTPEITVSSETFGDEWRLSVADNGIGIPPDQTHRLFQVFQRLHTRAAFEGTGIGLALCRKIAEHHGGHIAVESAGEGQGSTFRVHLPIRRDENATDNGGA